MSASIPRQPNGLLRLYRDLWRHAHGHRVGLAAAFGLLFASQLMKLALPWVSAQAINTLQLQGLAGLGPAGLWLAAVFGLTLASWALHGPGRLLERNVALTVRARVTQDLVDKALALPLAWHDAHHSGATTHRLEQSSRAIADFAQSQFIYLQNAVRLVGPVAALWWLEPWVGAAALLGLGVITLSITGFDRAMIRLARDENDADRRYNATLIDAMSNITSVLALRQARGVAALIGWRLQAVFAPLRRTIVVNESKWCAVDVLAQALSCSLLALYAVLAASGTAAPVVSATPPSPTLAIGNLYMVWEYALQAGGVVTAIAAHFQTFARQQADYASGDLIREADARRPDAKAAPDWQRLGIEALDYRHPDGTAGLSDVSMALQRGRRYALIGPSGSGKSTLLRVLAGLIEPHQAILRTDGLTVADSGVAAAARLRAGCTLIPQDAEVFEGTLAENLALCETLQGPPPPACYPDALRTACADDFIDLSDAGLAGRVAERGSNWSGGQRQRVALARGVLAAQGSPLVLLDEPTASLDPATEQRVFDRLFEAFRDSCVVISVHRLNVLDRFDAVLLMDGGRLVGFGTPAELAQRSATFRQLLAAQSRGG